MVEVSARDRGVQMPGNSPRALPAQRLENLRSILLVHPESVVSLTDLARRLTVSEQTVRRDLAILENSGLVKRTFGGAVILPSGQRIEPVLEARETEAANLKTSIGKAALELLHAGEIIYVDASSTVLAFVRQFPIGLSISATTSSVSAVREMSRRGLDTLTLLGGEYRGGSDCVGGYQAIGQVSQMRFTTALLSARAFDVDHGFTEARADEAALKREVVKRAQRTVLLVDSTKLGTVSPHHFANLDEVDVLVLDSQHDPSYIDRIRESWSGTLIEALE